MASPQVIHNFIPRPIHDAYRDGLTAGALNAATLFMDVSGFTEMTQVVQQGMDSQEEGAELITLRTGLFFTPLLAAVYQRGGFVTGFAGDGMTAVFPDEDAHSALSAALAIREAARTQRRQKTPYGTLTITLKQGLALGEVTWHIVGPDEQKTYFYRGAAIDACAEAEHHAAEDEIVLDASILPALPASLETESAGARFYRLVSADPDALSPRFDPLPPGPISLDVAQHFFDPSLLTDFIPGAFSPVTIVFISFEGDPPTGVLEGFVSAAIRAVRRFGGHFVEVDFGDKGGLLLAYFGAPVTSEDSITGALNCLHALRSEGTPLAWRAGVSHGTVFSGLQGSVIRSKYACMGTHVNLASRLMSQAEFGQTLVSADVAQDPAFAFTDLGPISYKGFPDPVPTFALVGKA